MSGRTTTLVSVRLPHDVVIRIKERALLGGQSVNKVMADLVVAGLQAKTLEARVSHLEDRTGVK